jgi:hypothetical protein
MISTGVMIRLGYVYGNLMVNVQPSNEKLVDRARRIISAAAGVDYARAGELLEAGGRNVPVAIVMAKLNVAREEAEQRLAAAQGRLRAAIGEGGARRATNIMDKFVIHGGVPLCGEIAVSGAKNSALPVLAACLLTEDPVILHRIPVYATCAPWRG